MEFSQQKKNETITFVNSNVRIVKLVHQTPHYDSMLQVHMQFVAEKFKGCLTFIKQLKFKWALVFVFAFALQNAQKHIEEKGVRFRNSFYIFTYMY